MRFSVITVTYNAEKYLYETLESVSAQKGVEFEHILWDGGSTDQTLEIAKKFNVNLIQGQDEGIADAMNKAAQYASGQYLLHLHADDRFVHSKVLLMIDRLFTLHSEVQWLYGTAQIIDQNNKYVRTTPYEPFSYKRLKKYNFISHPSTVVAKKLFDSVRGFDVSLGYCMDYDLWLRLGSISSPLGLATPFACFREHAGSVSISNPKKVADEAYHVRNRYVRNFERARSYRTWKKRLKKLEKQL